VRISKEAIAKRALQKLIKVRFLNLCSKWLLHFILMTKSAIILLIATSILLSLVIGKSDDIEITDVDEPSND